MLFFRRKLLQIVDLGQNRSLCDEKSGLKRQERGQKSGDYSPDGVSAGTGKVNSFQQLGILAKDIRSVAGTFARKFKVFSKRFQSNSSDTFL